MTAGAASPITGNAPVAELERSAGLAVNCESGRVEAPAGASLAYDAYGIGKPVLLMHGAGQTRHAWSKTARALADSGYRAITFDARGHGDSGWADVYGMVPGVADARAIIAALAPGEVPALIGASMGGMIGLAGLGGDNPLPASALVLVDIVPRMEQQGTAPILAFMTAHPNGFASVEEAAEAVSRYMTDRPRPSNVAGLRKNLREREGRFFWHWDPRFLDPAANLDLRENRLDLDRLAAGVQVPLMLVYGEHSKVVSEESVAHFRELVPQAEIALVRDAGHMVAGDANNPFTARIVDFLSRVYPAI